MTDHGFEVADCVHRDLFGTCGHRLCAVNRTCDGKRHVWYDEESESLDGKNIFEGDCCAFFEGSLVGKKQEGDT